MRNWLIRALGGVPAELWNQLLSEASSQRQVQTDEVKWLRASFEDEQRRVKELQDIIFTRFGVTFPQVLLNQSTGKEKPIELSRESWPRRKSRLEQADLKQHIDNLEQQWKSTHETTPMPPGNSPSEDSGEHVPSSSKVGA